MTRNKKKEYLNSLLDGVALGIDEFMPYFSVKEKKLIIRKYIDFIGLPALLSVDAKENVYFPVGAVLIQLRLNQM